MLLVDWDGRMTVLTRKRVSRHIDQCDVCTDRKHGALRPAALYGMAPLAPLPHVLREEVLGLCADAGPLAQSYREDVVQRAGPFRPNGFPQPIRPPRQRWLALSGVAAAVGVLIAIVATGIVTVLALSSHTPQPADAAGSANGTPPGSATVNPGSSGATSPSLSPTISVPAVTSVPPPAALPQAALPSASPTKAKPSQSATSSTSPSPTPTPRRPTPTPTPTATPFPTPTVTPSLPF